MNGQDNRQSGNKTKILLSVLAGILVIVIAAAAFILVSGNMKEKNYSEAIQSAEKYLTANNYENAIVEYKKAISVNPKEDEAYLALADVYEEQEETSKAKAILSKGLEETSSLKIKRRLSSMSAQNLVSTIDDGEKETQNLTVDLATASQNIGWNTSFMQKIISYTFDDFREEFGSVESAVMNDDGYLEVVHSGLDGTCYYRNTDENKEIVDVSRKTPYPEGMPEKISLNSLGIMFRNFDGGVSISRLQMFFGEKVEPKMLDDGYYVQTKSEDYILSVGTDSEGNITAPDAWNEILLVNANKGKVKTGHLSGVVTDAVTGDGVENAVLTFKPTKKEIKEETAKTGASGVFAIDLEPDVYTIVITADEYIEEEFIFEIEEGKNYSGEQFIISPELTKGSARIVLEWNAEPQDLDSYLSGDTDKGDDVFVNYRNKRSKAGNDIVAELDLDDTNGYGPETTTIYNLNGNYEFHVADFRRTGTMKEYGATVKVYLPGKQPVTITLDPNTDVKDVWVVCEIDHGELIIINDAPETDNFTTGRK